MGEAAYLLQVESLVFLDRGPFDLSLGEGECLGLAGPSGEGKSLLLRCLADLFPHQGLVSLRGTPCTEMEAPVWRRKVGLLPSENAWWMATAGEHFSETPESLDELGLSDELLRQPIHQLSSGERQRLAFLRLLQNHPRVLLLDEPTANLDERHARMVETWVEEYRRRNKAGVVWITHDHEQLRRCSDRQLQLYRDGFREEPPS